MRAPTPILLLTTLVLLVLTCGGRADTAAAGEGTTAGASSESFLEGIARATRSSLYSLFGYTDEGAAQQQQQQQQPPPKKSVALISSAEVTERVEIARELINFGRVDEAVDILLGVLEKEPDDADSYLPNMLLGTAFLTVQNKPAFATGFLYKAVSLSNWTDTTSIANLVASLMLDDDMALAERVAERGIDVGSPGAVFVLGQSLGRLFEARGNFTGAADWYLASALNEPTGGVEVWAKASTLYFPAQFQNLTVAESVLLRAFPHHPNSVEILFLLASVLHRRERIKEALQIYRRATSLDDNGRKDLWAMFATALHSSSNFEEALGAYQKAVQLSPTNPVLMANFAILLCDPSVNRLADGREAVTQARAIVASLVAANNNTRGSVSPTVDTDIQTAVDLCGEAQQEVTQTDAQATTAEQTESAQAREDVVNPEA